MKLPRSLVRAKFRFDIGMSLLNVLTFALMILANTERLQLLLPLPAKWLVIIGVPAGVMSVYLFGWVLDKLHFPQSYQDEANERNKMLRGVAERIGGDSK